MTRANVRRTIVERLRITGPRELVDAEVNRRQRREGYSWITQNPIRLAGGRISENRHGATLERVLGISSASGSFQSLQRSTCMACGGMLYHARGCPA